jgi:hypothetical protein
MSRDFSDAPLTVNGITVKPTWPWSKQYRNEVAEGMRQNGSSHLRAGEADQRYVKWYADQHGLTEAAARRHIKGIT